MADPARRGHLRRRRHRLDRSQVLTTAASTTRTLGAQLLADCLMLVGGLGLFVSLFLTWSHQLPQDTVARLGDSAALRGVPPNPTAWQVYSVADVLLALLVAALLAVAAVGGRRPVRLAILVAVAIALAFTAHARSVAPTSGLVVVDPATAPAYLAYAATAGPGETVAIISLALAAVGLGLSLVEGRGGRPPPRLILEVNVCDLSRQASRAT